MREASPAAMEEPLNVVITGGSTGIGRSMVDIFAAAGHRVLFTYLSSVAEAAALETRWERAKKARLDQGDVASVAHFGGIVGEWAGVSGVHVLVNNAALGSATVQRYVEGVNNGFREGEGGSDVEVEEANGGAEHEANGVDGLATEESDKQVNGDSGMYGARLENGVTKNGVGKGEGRHGGSVGAMLRRAARDEALMRVNALGPLWVTDALMDTITTAATDKSGRGRSSIIFIGSVGGGSASVFPEYCAADLMSKAAMSYLSKHLAAQHVRDCVDVLCVAPGATETEMFKRSTLAKIADVDAFIDGMPKRRLIQPNDVAATVFWLATQSPPGIFHGAVLDASMGLAVRPGLQTESRR